MVMDWLFIAPAATSKNESETHAESRLKPPENMYLCRNLYETYSQYSTYMYLQKLTQISAEILHQAITNTKCRPSGT